MLPELLGLNRATQGILLHLLELFTVIHDENLVSSCVHHENCVFGIFLNDVAAVVKQVESKI